ncbi:MAG: urease accessory protein UreD [Actinomycetota bacterium]|nr:urease accessory protein UreD [Actinomycetota bacterium]
MTSSVVAHARVLAERRGAGTRCSVLRSQPPLTLRATAEAIYLVGTAAGPLGGDDLGLDVTVAAGAELTMRSVAATTLLPGAGGGRSRARVDVAVGATASLRWRPQPVIVTADADHEATTTIELAGDASLYWREEVVLGRHGEEPGSLLQRLRVDLAGQPLLRNDLALGRRWPGSLGPAGTAGALALGTVLTVGGDRSPRAAHDGPGGHERVGQARLAVVPLGLRATLVTAIAPSHSHLQAALDACDVRFHGAQCQPTGRERGGGR